MLFKIVCSNCQREINLLKDRFESIYTDEGITIVVSNNEIHSIECECGNKI